MPGSSTSLMENLFRVCSTDLPPATLVRMVLFTKKRNNDFQKNKAKHIHTRRLYLNTVNVRSVTVFTEATTLFGKLTFTKF